MIADGIHASMGREEYDALPPEIINLSRLKLFKRSALHFRNAEKFPVPDSKALCFGRLEHWAILEPEKFKNDVAIWTRRTKAGNSAPRNGKFWDAFEAENPGKEIATDEEYRDAIRLRDAVFANPFAARLLSEGQTEVTVIWQMRGHKCKARVDFLGRFGIVDIKSAVDASPWAFGKAAGNYGYDVQAAWCVEGVGRATGEEMPFHDIAVEKTGGHVVQPYLLQEPELRRGRDRFSRWLDELAYCREHDTWPSYDNGVGVLPLKLPDYLMDEVADDAA